MSMTRTSRHPGPEAVFPTHGGDLAWAARRFGVPADGWLDLSTGINPWGYPVPRLPKAVWRDLPSAEDRTRLAATAATTYGVGEGGRVVAAAGSQALIELLPRVVEGAARVAVVSPTYGEHALRWRATGHEVIEAPDLEAAVGLDPDVLVLANPNNPDGRRTPVKALAAVIEAQGARGGVVVVDEAFADVAPDVSVAGLAGSPGLVVLRSIGKFHGLAGMRLGFALTAPDLAERLEAGLGPWAVSGPAIAVGTKALADAKWTRRTRKTLAEQAARLDADLTEAGLPVVGGTALFRLARAPRAWALFEHLGFHGILVRAFADRPDWLRLGLPPDDAARARLKAALASFPDR